MTTLIYIKGGIVVATHDDAQSIPASAYEADTVMPLPSGVEVSLFGAAPTLDEPGLIAYANYAQWMRATGGFTAPVNGSPVTFATTSDSFSLMTGKAVRLQMPNPPVTVNWQTGPTSFVAIAAADFTVIATEIADFFQATFDMLNSTIIPGITAGTITTTAQIDAALATVANSKS